MKTNLFPIKMSDIRLQEDFTKEPFHDKFVEASNHKSTSGEIIYLLKYKKFVDSPHVYSLCSVADVDQIQNLLEEIIKNNVPGVIIDTGIWRGGMAMWMKSVLKYHKDKRDLYLFDSFKYFPFPFDSSASPKTKAFTKIIHDKIPSVSDVKSNFQKFKLGDKNIYFIEGEYGSTIPSAKIDPIAFLRISGDFYQSTLLILEKFYPKISPKGCIFIDDYYNEDLFACKEAVDEYRRKHNIISPLVRCDQSCHWTIQEKIE